MLTGKVVVENIEDLNEEEDEHARLMKLQDRYEKESVHDMPNIDDDEYSRMIEMNENLGRNDANMEDLYIDDEEDKKPKDYENEIRRESQKLKNSSDDDYEILNKQSFGKIRSDFDSSANQYKKQASPTSSSMRRTAYTRDSELSSKFKTPQGYVNEVKFGKSTNSSNKVPLSSKRDANEDLNQEIIQLVKVRVEELQSKMKSKSDMFYVLRHMCKIFYCLSI